jgi:hypothetical protein
MSPRRSIGAAIGSGLCLGVAGLTKETTLAFLPVVAWALWQHSDPRNRRLVVTIGTAACLLTLGLYPMYALLKGELVPGPGHTSLLGTVWWQLVERTSSGSVLDADSAVRQLLGAWLSTDQVLVIGALLSAAVCVQRRSLRPLILAVVIGWVLIVRGGYVPYMQVIFLLPWSAILIAGAGELLVARIRRRPARWGVAVAASVLLVATTTAGSLAGQARRTHVHRNATGDATGRGLDRRQRPARQSRGGPRLDLGGPGGQVRVQPAPHPGQQARPRPGGRRHADADRLPRRAQLVLHR